MANDPKKRRRTVDLALISLVTDLAHEQCNALLPVHSNVHGIVMVAEKTCERCVCRGKGDQQQPPALTLGHTHQEVPSSLDLLVCERTSFAFPSLCATAVGRCWCRRESVHVTLASLVELLAWTDFIRSSSSHSLLLRWQLARNRGCARLRHRPRPQWAHRQLELSLDRLL